MIVRLPLLWCVAAVAFSGCGGGSGLDPEIPPDELRGNPSAELPKAFMVEVTGSNVTVQATNVTLGAVLAALSEATALVVVPNDSLSELVTVQFEGLPMERALARILAGRNYVLQAAPLLVHVLNRRMDGRDDDVTALALTDPDKAVRLAVLFELGPGEAAPRKFLETALGDPDASVRAEAVEALGNLEEEVALKLLGTAFSDSNDTVREIAVETLGQLEVGERSLEMLGSALGDPSPIVREEAVYALWRHGGPRAISLLESALADPHPAVRAFAEERLEALSR